MSGVFTPSGPLVKEYTLNLAQAAASYDVLTAVGTVLIEAVQIHCTVVGATFTSVAIATDQTTPVAILSAGDGAVANITVNKNITPTLVKQALPFILRNGQKIRFTLVGATGTGELRFTVVYYPVTSGASI